LIIILFFLLYIRTDYPFNNNFFSHFSSCYNLHNLMNPNFLYYIYSHYIFSSSELINLLAILIIEL